MTIARAVVDNADRSASLAHLHQFLDETGTVPVVPDRADFLPVAAAFAVLLPHGLPRGTVLGLDGDPYLAAALIGSAVREGGCAALIGIDGLAFEAVGAAGAPLDNLVLVDAPGEAWVDAAEALIGAVDVLLVQPPGTPSAGLVRRIGARLRRGVARTALLAVGAWPAPAQLIVRQAQWTGLEVGHGQLRQRPATVSARGRTSWSRDRTTHMLLPAADGTAQPMSPSAPAGRPRLHLVGAAPPSD